MISSRPWRAYAAWMAAAVAGGVGCRRVRRRAASTPAARPRPTTSGPRCTPRRCSPRPWHCCAGWTRRSAGPTRSTWSTWAPAAASCCARWRPRTGRPAPAAAARGRGRPPARRRRGTVRDVAELPPVTGLLVANEWLDDVPLDVVELDPGRPAGWCWSTRRHASRPARRRTAADRAWLERWWPLANAGDRAEIGRTRDEAWAARRSDRARRRGRGRLRARGGRPGRVAGTLAGYRAGAQVPPVPDGSLQPDRARRAGLGRRRGPCGGGRRHPPRRPADRADGARRGPAAAAGRAGPGPTRTGTWPRWSGPGAAAELTDRAGLGAFRWLVQGVGMRVPFPPAATRARVRRAPAPPRPPLNPLGPRTGPAAGRRVGRRAVVGSVRALRLGRPAAGRIGPSGSGDQGPQVADDVRVVCVGGPVQSTGAELPVPASRSAPSSTSRRTAGQVAVPGRRVQRGPARRADRTRRTRGGPRARGRRRPRPPRPPARAGCQHGRQRAQVGGRLVPGQHRGRPAPSTGAEGDRGGPGREQQVDDLPVSGRGGQRRAPGPRARRASGSTPCAQQQPYPVGEAVGRGPGERSGQHLRRRLQRAAEPVPPDAGRLRPEPVLEQQLEVVVVGRNIRL